MVSKTHLFNKAIIYAGKLNHHRYYSFINQVAIVQQRKLLRYISDNYSTAYGRTFDFKQIKDYAAYAAKVPVIEDWGQMEPYIKRVERGEQQVITADKIIAFEETSGSTGFSKLIPYNKALKKEFQKALQVWMFDLYASSPQSFYGKSYWSISPVLKQSRYTEGGIKIGLDNDADYFNSLTGYLLSQIMAVNLDITKIKEPPAFYSETIKQLLLQPHLSFISVWSPTFFLQLDAFLRTNLDSILNSIKPVNTKRYDEIKKLGQPDFAWKDIWPHLSCLSCWTDAQASLWMPQVEKNIGKVPVQPKGLLSTEAVTSFPIKDASYPALAYQSHFFEFRSVENYSICLAHQLIQNECYEVIVTTAGGLYRYATKDVVQVMGFHHQVPLLKFVGRQNRTSDLVGEKVNEVQVNEIMNTLIKNENPELPMTFIRPRMLQQSAVYILYMEAIETMTDTQYAALTGQFENLLCQNPYYLQALRTGQLKNIQYRLLKKGFKESLIHYYKEKKLIRDGDIKIPVLFLAHELQDLTDLL